MDAVEEVKNRLSIEDVVGEYVQLKRAGRNWKGLSPWTSERTPSLMISPDKQIWHDFSSGKGGNLFSFVMEMEGLDFKGALEVLARKAGVDLEQFRRPGQSGRAKTKERLLAALDTAAKFYQIHLSKHRPALEYVLKKRQFSRQTLLDWRLGYSPETGTELVAFLRSKGFSDQEIKNAGLGTQRYRGLGDMFRGRIMIPLCDPGGHVIGFTARQLKDNPNVPKYINTPQTMLYDKSRHVFGLHLAKDAIRRNKFAVIAEGNLDVIASHQAGIKQVVATAGTALTEWQLKALSRFGPDVRLSFDADRAGLNATERAIPIAGKVGVSLGVITIPNGKDPDELIRQDPSKWQEAIIRPLYAVDWLIERHQKQLDISSALGKRQFSDIVLNVVKDLPDPVEQEHYLNAISRQIGVSPEALEAKLKNIKSPQTASLRLKTIKTPRVDSSQSDIIRTQNHLLALALKKPELQPLVANLKPQILLGDDAKVLLALLQADNTSERELLPLADYVKMLTLLFEELYQDVAADDLADEAQRLKAHLISQYVKMQKHKIVQELAVADRIRSQALLEAVKKLDLLLKQS